MYVNRASNKTMYIECLLSIYCGIILLVLYVFMCVNADSVFIDCINHIN